MNARKVLAALFLVPAAGASWAAAQEVRYVQEGGVTYREERRVVQRPVVETRMEARQRTIYREQLATETVPTTRTLYTPVTEYRWEPRWHGLWNPFAQPYVAYHMVPSTRWETRTEQVQQTVTRRDVVPQTETVQVPVTTQRVVNQEIVTRTPVQGALPAATGTPPVSLARQTSVGGISKLENDPPRDGAGGWHSAKPNVGP